jgi:hypothetical protein
LDLDDNGLRTSTGKACKTELAYEDLHFHDFTSDRGIICLVLSVQCRKLAINGHSPRDVEASWKRAASAARSSWAEQGHREAGYAVRKLDPPLQTGLSVPFSST